MPGRLPEAPPSAIELLRGTLSAFVVDGKYPLRSLAGKRPDRIAPAQGHPVYNLELNDITAHRGLNAALLTAWRFLLVEGEVAVAAAEIAVNSKTGNFQFHSVTGGPYVGATSEAFQTRLDSADLQGQEWEVRLLRVPGLYLVALWLHSTSGSEDRFVPIGPTPEFLERGRTYSWSELNEHLKPAATRRIVDRPS